MVRSTFRPNWSRDRDRPNSKEDEMIELSEIFNGDLTTEIFCFSSVVFLLTYAGFVLLERWKSPIHRHVVSAIGAALAAIVVGLGLYTTDVTMASARGQAAAANLISPQELHRSIDMKANLIQEIEDLTFVFPNVN
jgi:hypothetical protein